MNAILWKDLTVLKKSKGSFLFSIILGLFIAISSLISIEKFQQSYSNLILLIPLIVGFNLNNKIFFMEISDRSLESILATHYSVRKILLIKARLITIVSLCLGWIILFISTFISWIMYNEIVIPSINNLLILAIAVPFVFSIEGLVGSCYWFFANITVTTFINSGVFIFAVLFLNLSAFFLTYSLRLMVIITLIVSAILIIIFLGIIRKINKEKVAITKL
ncbi:MULTISPECIES: hypothetical protein [Petrotoga]|uniref:ABC-2 family transporter n=2 Tax=Petrotoga sibirica TaxID=156202 RepID=A0A4R8EHW0_9BACT|nr:MULTISPECIES: hypothetical protein [Petrotoga]POZ89275.1 hypothetical protein AA80_01210 [Petrotoga sibirica DSM 13575]POZ91047.1 hypothetical protein AD60_03495 [Petrotoga sp. SL27]TDX09965.1 hypothetical protein C8D74_1253 [Petrotoga sibirica]